MVLCINNPSNVTLPLNWSIEWPSIIHQTQHNEQQFSSRITHFLQSCWKLCLTLYISYYLFWQMADCFQLCTCQHHVISYTCSPAYQMCLILVLVQKTDLNVSMLVLHNLTEQFLVNRDVCVLLGQSCVSLCSKINMTCHILHHHTYSSTNDGCTLTTWQVKSFRIR